MSCTFLNLKVAVRPGFQNSPLSLKKKKQAKTQVIYMDVFQLKTSLKPHDATFKEQNLNKKPNVWDHTTTKAENPSTLCTELSLDSEGSIWI